MRARIRVCVWCLVLHTLNHRNSTWWGDADPLSSLPVEWDDPPPLCDQEGPRQQLVRPHWAGVSVQPGSAFSVSGVLTSLIALFYENSLSVFSELEQFSQREQILKSDFPKVLDALSQGAGKRPYLVSRENSVSFG